MPSENTVPELKIKKLLEGLKVAYIQQYPLSGFYYDFMLPEHRILIEVNGDYFHANPYTYPTAKRNIMQRKNHKRDRIKLGVALKYGYEIIYVWEKDLKMMSRVGEEMKGIVENRIETNGVKHILEDVLPRYKDFYVKRKATKKTSIKDKVKTEETGNGRNDRKNKEDAGGAAQTTTTR